MVKVDRKLIEGAKANLLNTEKFVSVKSGLNNIDLFSGGFAYGQLIIMGGRPSMGKTTFACSLIDNVCINAGKSCAFFTTQMSARQAIERLIRLHGNVKYSEKDGQEFSDRIIKAAADGNIPRKVFLLSSEHTANGERNEKDISLLGSQIGES